MNELYSKLAYDYDEFGAIVEYLGDEKIFFEKLFKKHNVKTILDCACGTGQHLLMFSEMGFDVFGSDYSDSMIEVADENLKKHGKSINLCKCDFRYLEHKHSKTFDAIVCLTNSLPHLHSDNDIITALQSMKNRLNNDGLLVLTSGTTHYTLTLPPIEVVVNREDFSRVFIKEHDDMFQTIHILDLYHSDKRMESNQYDIVYRILLDKEYRKLLSQVGFKDIHIYGGYDMSDYNEKSQRLIVVAGKESAKWQK